MRFLREYFIDRFGILTSHCSNWRRYVVKISKDYLPLFFRKKLFLKKFAFSLSDGNKSKNYPIVLKFGINVAFIHLQIKFRVRCPKKSVHYEKRYLRLKIYFKNFYIAFSPRILDLSTRDFNQLCTN